MNYLIIFCIAIIISITCTFLVKSIAHKINFISVPNPIVPQHVKPIAYLGGVGIFCGLLLTILYLIITSWYEFKETPIFYSYFAPLSFGTTAFLVLGVIDDRKTLKPLGKFVLQLIIALTAVLLGLKADFTSIYFIDILISVFWVLVVVNASNFVDVCDGLLSGISLVIFLIIGFYCPFFAPLSLVIAGSVTGFLVFNFPPASIFLGDAGSHLLGFLIAAIGIIGVKVFPNADGIIWMVMIAGLLVFELIFITTMRILRGKAWWKGSGDHFSLRLQRFGWSKIQVNVLSCIVCLLCNLAACYNIGAKVEHQLIICLSILLMFSTGWFLLAKIEVD